MVVFFLNWGMKASIAMVGGYSYWDCICLLVFLVPICLSMPTTLCVLPKAGSWAICQFRLPRHLGLEWGHWGGAGDSKSSHRLWIHKVLYFFILTVVKFCISKPPEELVKNAHSEPLTPENLIQLRLKSGPGICINKRSRCFWYVFSYWHFEKS